jgi:hypothetical protein
MIIPNPLFLSSLGRIHHSWLVGLHSIHTWNHSYLTLTCILRFPRRWP